MTRFGDPDFSYHKTIAQIWGIVAAKLVDSPVIPFNATNYAKALVRYTEDAKRKAVRKLEGNPDSTPPIDPDELFSDLFSALEDFMVSCLALDIHSQALTQTLHDNPIPWWKFWEKLKLFYEIRQVNTQYKLLERGFLYEKGLDGRSWFKHVVFAPGKWTGYSGAVFPGIVEGIEEGDWGGVRRWVGLVSGIVEGNAARIEEGKV